MRQKKESVLSVRWNDDGLPLPVRVYRAKYQAISQVLDRNPEILNRIHDDLRKLSQGGRQGREGDYTSENILRALVVQSIEGLSFRDAVVRIAESEFLQDFLRMRKKTVMDYSFLNKCFKAVRPETWKAVNELLSQDAVRRDLIDAATIRTDTTVVETNIHYPTDSSLLWDVSARGLALARAGARDRAGVLPTPLPQPQDQAAVPVHRAVRDQQVEGPATAGEDRLPHFDRAGGVDRGDCREILRCGPVVEQPGLGRRGVGIADVSAVDADGGGHRAAAQMVGETVPARDRVFSIFEPHTELLKRGKRQKPTEFGHKVLLCETPEKFITDYEVYERQQADCALTESVIRRHEALFGTTPEVLVGDMGFCPTAEKFEELEGLVGTLAIPRRLRDFANRVLAKWQAFRAGIEGTISGLKRVFRLFRCFFRGFKSFSSAVGLGVFCHNLIVLAGSS